MLRNRMERAVGPVAQLMTRLMQIEIVDALSHSVDEVLLSASGPCGPVLRLDRDDVSSEGGKEFAMNFSQKLNLANK